LNDNKSPSAARIDVDKNRQAVKVYSDRGVPDVQFVAY
jgi:hypothetical protein